MSYQFNNSTGSSGGGSGVTGINSDTTAAQSLSVGTAGTDFAITDAGGGSHVFNLPSASAANRGVITTGAQTIAGDKAFSGKITSGNYVLTPGETSDTVTAGAVTCDMSASNAHSFTLVANTTITLVNFKAGSVGIIRMIQDGTGSWTYTWVATGRTVKWPSGVSPLPAGANKIDIAQYYDDGTNIYMSFSGNY